MQLTTRQTLKRLLLAVVATIAGVLAMGAAASAAVTEAPDITASPNSPNTTLAIVSFTYKVSDDETSEATTLRYYCRVYDADAAPPAAGTGWATCGTTTSAAPEPASRTYVQANGNWTFEVAIRETTNISTQGPIASSNWTQNLPAPAKTVVFTQTPDNPNTSSTNSQFKIEGGEGEEELVAQFECKVDDGTPQSCNPGFTDPPNTGSLVLAAANGEHSIEARAVNAGGVGPWSEPFEWEVAVANPEPNVRLNEVGTDVWHGALANSQISGVFANNRPKNIGDFNGDGKDDLGLVTRPSAANIRVDVIWKLQGVGSRQVGTQAETEGFRVAPVVHAFLGLGAIQLHPVGDQNQDGFDDILVSWKPPGTPSPAGPTPSRFAVIYGGLDPTELPLCAGSSVTRCLDPLAMDTGPDGQGYILVGSDDTFGQSVYGGLADPGDFDGDGIDDFVFVHQADEGYNTIVKGGVRTGITQIQDLTADEKLNVKEPAEILSGTTRETSSLGDLDGDGRDDFFVASAQSGTHTVLYGRPFGEAELDLATLDADDGFRVFTLPLANANASGLGGDVNGDGIRDFAVVDSDPGGLALENGKADQTVNVIFTPERGSGGVRALGQEMIPGTGYAIGQGGLDIPTAELGSDRPLEVVGDINNDGLPDLLVGAWNTAVDGYGQAGAGYLLLTQQPTPEGLLGVGPELTPSLGVGLLGSAAGDRAGGGIVALGDLDEDGLPDFGVGAPNADPNGINNAGSLYIVYGKSLIAKANTGNAVAVGNESAVLNAGVSTNNRDSEVWFEYGTTDQYGETSPVDELEASNGSSSASVPVESLTKNTTYHYRAVVKNDLGLIRYGDDRTFTTTNVAPDPPVETCDLDPTGPGCAKYCEVNPTALGCPDYNWCANNPGKCSTGGEPSNARLSLISTTKRIAVKRGKKGTVAVAVVNTGGKAANGVKLCVKAPKRHLRVKRCFTIGSLGSGKSRIVRVKVSVKKKAKRGAKVVNLTANGTNVSAKRTKARVVIR